MLLTERNRRIALGFLEHIGSISIARYRNRSQSIDWARLMKEWDTGENGEGNDLRKLDPDVPGLVLTYFACHGSLPLHIDMVGRNKLTFGAIIHSSAPLSLDAPQQSVEVEAGALFVLDPATQHGATTDGSFLFATIDLAEHEAPTAEKFRRRVNRDLRRIADRHANKEKS